MDRSIIVEIDQTTWPNPPALPSFPPSFQAGASVEQFNIPALLLMIGFLTTPPENKGPTLSQYWAFVRYLSAITSGSDLKITRAFTALDSHQKTILSDDFGVGVPMLWLCGALDILAVTDGNYFIKNLAALVGAKAVKTSARGPNKSPDFVALDVSGNWHVIECKGTQSGRAYRDGQLGHAGRKPRGGIAQKRTIIFPTANTGQRLACGLAIGVETKPLETHLRIVDPPGKKNLVVKAEWLQAAKEVALCGTLAKSLRLAGFEATANYLSSRARAHTLGSPSRIRNRHVEELRVLAREELSPDHRESRTVFERGGLAYLGRESLVDLVRPIGHDSPFVSASVRQGVNTLVLDQLLAVTSADNPAEALSAVLLEMGGQLAVETDSDGAILKVGSMLAMELGLKRRGGQRETQPRRAT